MKNVKTTEVSYTNFLRSNVELNIINYGYSEMRAGQEVKEEVFSHNTLYLVIKGRVNVSINGNSFSVQENELFLLPASHSCGFVSDIAQPASFYWVSFWGFKAKPYLDIANLTATKPIFKCSDNSIFNYMKTLVDECVGHNEESETKALGCLYQIISKLLSVTSRKLTSRQLKKTEYVKTAIDFIRNNYMEDINVSDISNRLALNRTYFSVIFKEVVGISPIDYLIKYRIDQSIILMVNPLLSITEIASLVGFTDLVSFSIRFKSITERSPSDYRKVMFEHKIDRYFTKKK